MGYDETRDMEKRPHTSEEGAPRSDSLIEQNGKLMQEDGAVPGETFEIGNR